MKIRTITFALMLVCIRAATQQIVEAEYFVGSDPGPGNGTAISLIADNTVSLTSSVPTSSLNFGIQRISVRSKSSSGIWSNTKSRVFVLNETGNNPLQEIIAAEYFIDTDPGPGMGTSIDINAGTSISLESLVPTNIATGFHKLAVRTMSTAGVWSSTKSRMFVVNVDNSNPIEEIDAAEFFLNTDPGAGQGTPIDLTQSTSVSLQSSVPLNVPTGVYKICIRTHSTSGLWSNTAARLFLVKTGGVTTFYEVVAAEYFVDTDPGEGLGTAITLTPGTEVVADGTVATDGLSSGQHTLGVRFKGSTGMWSQVSTAPFTVVVPGEPFIYTVQMTDPLCAGDNTGSIDIQVTGNPSIYTFNWNGTDGDASLSDIAAGDYTLVVTDVFGDVQLDTVFVLNAPDAITIQSAMQEPLCAGDSNGSIEAAAQGGTPPYAYDWNGADPGSLTAGSYSLTVTDALGCLFNQTFTLIEPDALTAAVSATVNPTDELTCDGSSTISPSGGTPPYDIAWNDPSNQTGDQATELCVGVYEALITDAQGCVTSTDVTLIANDVITLVLPAHQLKAFPNPTRGQWQLELTLQQSIELAMRIYDASGKLLREGSPVHYPAGTSLVHFDLTQYPAGNYVVQITGNGLQEEFQLQLAQ
jgi:hypothetical protein